MKNFVLYCLLCLGLTGIISCDDKEYVCGMPEFDYMIFGHFYGFCGGEGCIEIFKIENQKLYEDMKDEYPGSQQPYEGIYTLLSQEKYDLVKDLVHDFPEELYAETETVLGMPDAGDWGGAYVAIRYGGPVPKMGFWLLDQMDDNMPQVYNDFVDRINEKIAIINQ